MSSYQKILLAIVFSIVVPLQIHAQRTTATFAGIVTVSVGHCHPYVVEKVRASKDDAFGYNALTDTFENLIQAGVIDPTKVARMALQNAASIAGLLLTTECTVVEHTEEKRGSSAAGHGGGMDGMY